MRDPESRTAVRRAALNDCVKQTEEWERDHGIEAEHGGDYGLSSEQWILSCLLVAG